VASSSLAVIFPAVLRLHLLDVPIEFLHGLAALNHELAQIVNPNPILPPGRALCGKKPGPYPVLNGIASNVTVVCDFAR